MNDSYFDPIFRFKTIRWWAELFPLNVPGVVVGWRGVQGIVRRVETVPADMLREMGKEHWTPGQLTNFLQDLLSWIKERVEVEDPRVVHGVRWNPTSGGSGRPKMN